MSETTTTTTGTIGTTWSAEVGKPKRVALLGLIEVQVLAANELRFVPKNDVGRFLLEMLQHGWSDAHVIAQYQPATDQGPGEVARYGRGLEHLDVRFSSRPMICSGDDPYFTGWAVSEEAVEVAKEAARAFMEKQNGGKRSTRKSARRKRTR